MKYHIDKYVKLATEEVIRTQSSLSEDNAKAKQDFIDQFKSIVGITPDEFKQVAEHHGASEEVPEDYVEYLYLGYSLYSDAYDQCWILYKVND